ncbi:hypothetical protein E2C01_034618 [Portunus trituberculatus]|uniref:Uncharacterized protein n=1 Tax=Portunus trituberculatus TaxID=210409 RepID=A0A5B7F7E6_PORTR|nr:hypothetical protein [Portunus trituberculatus]
MKATGTLVSFSVLETLPPCTTHDDVLLLRVRYLVTGYAAKRTGVDSVTRCGGCDGPLVQLCRPGVWQYSVPNCY